MMDNLNKPNVLSNKKRKSMFMIVFKRDKQGKPISYKRLYCKTYENIMSIEKAVNNHYGWGDSLGEKDKLFLGELADKTFITAGQLSDLLTLMATMDSILERKVDRWQTIHKEPFILLQQQHKHLKKEKYGIKTPLFVMPYKYANGK